MKDASSNEQGKHEDIGETILRETFGLNDEDLRALRDGTFELFSCRKGPQETNESGEQGGQPGTSAE